MRPLLALAAALLVSAPHAARAHGVSQEVRRRGETWEIRVRYDHGRPLAGATYQVTRPGSAEVVREGKTGPEGWVELVPDAPGTWHVKVVDRTGHGKTVAVEVPAAAPSSPATTPTTSTTTAPTTSATPSATSTSTSNPTSTETTSAATGRLKIALAAGGILAAFVLLAAVRRRGGGR